MIKPDSAKQLAVDILGRSICAVRVGAAIQDRYGYIVAWGWNSVGSGFGEHAECAAIRRANKKRLNGATIYVASTRTRNSKPIMSKPCLKCQENINTWKMKVCYRGPLGDWIYV